jgi:hypothetical protein
MVTIIQTIVEVAREWAVETVGVALFCYGLFLAAVWCVFC